MEITGNSKLVIWGDNSYGQLTIPTGTSFPVSTNYLNLVSGLDGVTKISVGYSHIIANRRVNGQDFIYAWGSNENNESVVWGSDIFPYIDFDAGINTSYYVDNYGRIHGYGEDLIFSPVFDSSDKIIINWAETVDFDPTTLRQPLSLYPRVFKQVKAGPRYVLAIDNLGRISGYGDNTNPVISGSDFVNISNAGFVTGIAAGYSHALALYNNGLITGWGDNSYGQLNFDTGYLSGIKVSTKANHCLAMGIGNPIITNITRNSNIWTVSYNKIDSDSDSIDLLVLTTGVSGLETFYLENKPLSQVDTLNKNANFTVTTSGEFDVRLVEYTKKGYRRLGNISKYNASTSSFNQNLNPVYYYWGETIIDANFWINQTGTNLSSYYTYPKKSNVFYDGDNNSYFVSNVELFTKKDNQWRFYKQQELLYEYYIYSYNSYYYGSFISGFTLDVTKNSNNPLFVSIMYTGDELPLFGGLNIPNGINFYNAELKSYSNPTIGIQFRYYLEELNTPTKTGTPSYVRFKDLDVSTKYAVCVSHSGVFDEITLSSEGRLVLFDAEHIYTNKPDPELLSPGDHITGYIKDTYYITGNSLGHDFNWYKAKILNTKGVYGIAETPSLGKVFGRTTFSTIGDNLFSGNSMEVLKSNIDWIDFDMSANGQYHLAFSDTQLFRNINYGQTNDWYAVNLTNFGTGRFLDVRVSLDGRYQLACQENITEAAPGFYRTGILVYSSNFYGITWQQTFSGIDNYYTDSDINNNGDQSLILNSRELYKGNLSSLYLSNFVENNTTIDLSAGYNNILTITSLQVPIEGAGAAKSGYSFFNPVSCDVTPVYDID